MMMYTRQEIEKGFSNCSNMKEFQILVSIAIYLLRLDMYNREDRWHITAAAVRIKKKLS